MKSLQKTLLLLLLAVIIFSPIGVYTERQQIYDWWRLRNYVPPVQIVKLANDTTLTQSARHVFYVNQPSLEDKQAFNGHCNSSERTIVLGCYVNQKGIYIYDVTDPRLAGVEQVTAAHELLHAAYDRLSPNEKKHVDSLITQAYASVTDPRIRANIESYKNAGADTTNELHSILGTEVSNLSPSLEAYYSRYFTNRAKIVHYSQQYEGAFDARQKRVSSDDAILSVLKPQIETLESSLQTQLANLNSQRKSMDTLLAARQYDQYNSQVPVFNVSVATYNNDVTKTRNLIDRYNGLVNDRNASAIEENQLIKAIDSRPDTAVQTQK